MGTVREKQKVEQVQFLKRLGELLNKGYEMDQALSFLAVHASRELQGKITGLKKDLREGKTLWQSIEPFSLPGEAQSFVYFYEEQGELAEGLVSAAQLAEKRAYTKKQLQKLLRYPIFLLWGAAVVLIVLNQFVVPHFKSLYATMESAPPWLTQFFFQFLTYVPYMLIGLAMVGFIASMLIWKQYKKRSPHDQIAVFLKIKPIKATVQQAISYYFSLQLGRLLETGMSLQQALNVFEGQDYLRFFKEEARWMNNELERGESFIAYIKEKPYYLDELAAIVENGMRTGTIASDLQQYSEWLYQEMDDRLQKGVVWLQPVLLLAIGAFVFGLFLVVMLPMFEMIGSLE
ncbi:competence protein ComG [Shouchella clausii]|uniref:competence type IV pilus assembly protein ComGB n=1 Tax=Shouchella clausii TaxID=79880 RepID=UPI000793BACF|nr:competence type IV pilus assembly protein ComGB [Shouchella clausii]KKI87610.1 hypothetical protein WZ76_03855 [Shouchella clausii]PAF10804.1 hypothetical protein CHH65_04350 [Shouchella clausii]GIN17859.1 competence protein ComG [Shouchella clausii]